MRKVIFFHILSICLLAFVSCGGSKKDNEKKHDWSYNLRKNSTEPFGCFLASNSLKDIFPTADINMESGLFGKLDRANGKSYFNEKNHLNIIVANDFYPTEDEVDILKKYITNGGHVFLAAASTNNIFDSIFNSSIVVEELSDGDSLLSFRWGETGTRDYQMKFPWPITYIDKSSGEVLGTQKLQNGYGTIVTKQQIGYGTFVFCTAPELLSNYFLIKGDNINYYENIFSHFDKYISEIRWQSQKVYNGEYQRPSK